MLAPQFKNLGILAALALGLSHCSKTALEVSYPQMLVPAEGYSELKKLAVGIDPYLAPELRDALLKNLQSCPAFQEVVLLEKPVKISGTNPKDYLDAFIKTSEVAQAAQGILSLQIEVNKQSSSSEKSQVWVFDDKPAFDWAGSLTRPFTDSLGLATEPELTQPRRGKRREALVRSDKTQFVARFVVYNRVKGAILHDRVFSHQSQLQNFSRKSGIKKGPFLKMVEKAIVDEATFHACPVRSEVTRQLYYGQNPADPNAAMINEGIELAKDDRWPLAASKWSNVLIKNPKQGLAQHNLAVHFERQGELLKAMEHYRKASLSPEASTLIAPVYDEILKNFQAPSGQKPLYPQVAFVSGSGWVYVRSEGDKIPEKRVFSVYRIEASLAPDLLSSQGLSLKEIGRLRLQAYDKGYFTGRVREQLVDFPVKAGDFIIVD